MTSFSSPTLPAISVQYYGQMRNLDVDLLKTINEITRNLDAILNRGISFSDNVDCRLATVTSDATPGNEFSVAHKLGKIPTGRIIYSQNKAGTLYNGTSANTSTTIYFKSDVGTCVFKIIVF